MPLEFSKIPRNADHAVSEGPGFPVDFRRDAGRITPVDMVRTGEDKIESAGFGKNQERSLAILFQKFKRYILSFGTYTLCAGKGAHELEKTAAAAFRRDVKHPAIPLFGDDHEIPLGMQPE